MKNTKKNKESTGFIDTFSCEKYEKQKVINLIAAGFIEIYVGNNNYYKTRNKDNGLYFSF